MQKVTMKKTRAPHLIAGFISVVVLLVSGLVAVTLYLFVQVKTALIFFDILIEKGLAFHLQYTACHIL